MGGAAGTAGAFATTAGFAVWVDAVAALAAGALAAEPEPIALAGAALGAALGAAETAAPANNAPAAPNAIISRFINGPPLGDDINARSTHQDVCDGESLTPRNGGNNVVVMEASTPLSADRRQWLWAGLKPAFAAPTIAPRP
jgi:hypothetical protein